MDGEGDTPAVSLPDDDPGFRIRAMKAGDLREVLAIEKVSFVSPWTKGFFEEALLSPIAANFVIVDETGLAGYLCLYTVIDEAHILNVAVRPDERKRGYGAALLTHMIERLGRKGVTHFHLEVREGNDAAILLYRKFGFRAVGRRRKYYTDTNEDAILMHLHTGNG